MWCRYTRRAREDGRLPGSARYLEIRYEDLSADTTRCLARVFDFLGVDVTPSTLARMAADQRFEQQKATGGTAIPVVRGGSERGEPDGFFRNGLVDSWRAELSTIQKMIVWRYTGRLMRLLGYGWRGRTVTARSQS